MVNFLTRSLVLVLVFASLGLASKPATVVTETGKTHKVNFLRMSSDTIYLWVLKPGGTGFNISGHKSRFKSIEFKDGSWFDFSWANYDPDARVEGNSSSLPPPELEPPASVPSDEADASRSNVASPAEPEVKPEAPVSGLTQPVSPAAKIDAPRWSAEESTPPAAIRPAELSVESAPQGATIFLNDSMVAGQTPMRLHPLAPGAYTVRAARGALSASTSVSLFPGDKERVNLVLAGDEPKPVGTKAGKRRRGRASGIVLTIGSVGVLAAGGVEFYFAYLDKERALESKKFLEESVVPGGDEYTYHLQRNKARAEVSRLETTVGSVLAGVGMVGLVFGLTLTF